MEKNVNVFGHIGHSWVFFRVIYRHGVSVSSGNVCHGNDGPVQFYNISPTFIYSNQVNTNDRTRLVIIFFFNEWRWNWCYRNSILFVRRYFFRYRDINFVGKFWTKKKFVKNSFFRNNDLFLNTNSTTGSVCVLMVVVMVF